VSPATAGGSATLWQRFWPMALPVAYAAHLSEEAFGGRGFVAWMREVGIAPTMDERRFLVLNAIFFSVVATVSIAAVATRIRAPRLRFAAATFGAVLAMNGAIHLLSSATTGTYSPGTWTGALVYLPLGVLLFATPGVGLAPRDKGAAWVAAGGIHVVVFLLARYGLPGLG